MYTVIIADDEPNIHEGIKTTIHSALPELDIIQIFEDGSKLYNYLGTHQPDILLLDIEMPGKSGLDIARLIDETSHRCYVIIITAHHNFEYAKKAIDYRVDAFLTKPFSSSQLIDTLGKAITNLAAKNNTLPNKWPTYRTYLRTLYTNKIDSLLHEDIFLCCETTSVNELLCTEITFNEDILTSLSVLQKSSLFQALTEHIENDNLQQSIFFLGNNFNNILFLVFSKQTPDLCFISNISNILKTHIGDVPEYTIKKYISLSDYRIQLSFIREMDTFFNMLTTSGKNPAKKYLTEYVTNLPDNYSNMFSQFLTDTYLPEYTNFDKCNTDLDIIIKKIDALITHTFGTHTGNYIVESAKEYVHTHYASSLLSLDATAEALAISANYLGRIFKKHTGQNFSEYLQNYRMKQAQSLLKNTHMPTVEVAAAVGYSNPVYFRISFKTHFGMTPSQFRQLQTRKE